MFNLLALIVPIALLDSLNPVTVAVHVYLLGTPQPKTRTTTFMLGIFLAYFGGGLILAFGLESVLRYFNNLSETTWQIIQAAIGLALLIFAWYSWNSTRKADETKHSASMSPADSFWLGFAVTLSDLPTAIPYLAAIERMLQAKLSTFELLGAMAFYNAVYLLPLAAIFGIYLFSGTGAAAIMQKINAFINRWSSTLLTVASALAGLVLLANCAASIYGESFF